MHDLLDVKKQSSVSVAALAQRLLLMRAVYYSHPLIQDANCNSYGAVAAQAEQATESSKPSPADDVVDGLHH
jgi:hypothetical protein